LRFSDGYLLMCFAKGYQEEMTHSFTYGFCYGLSRRDNTHDT
jgi:hypothetical protein